MTQPNPSPRQPQDAPAGARFARDITDVDLSLAASFAQAVPHGAFDALREAGGVAWHDELPVDDAMQTDFVRFVDSPGFWTVTSHELVNEVLRNSDRFSSELGTTMMLSLDEESLPTLRAMLINMDAPHHTRIRRILQPSFTPRSVEKLHESVRVNAREIMVELDGQRECELVTAVSAELPLRVLADLLGMPRSDRHLIFEWSNALIEAEGIQQSGESASGVEAMAAMVEYGQAMAAQRREHPTDDMVSTIANAQVDGDRLDDWEFAMFWVLLVVAGNETTRNAISGSVAALQEHRRWSQMTAQGEVPMVALEELLRYVSPVAHFRRTATADTTLGDQHIRAGDKVVVWFGAANRDPNVFSNRHGLELDRAENPHMAFGIGPHYCLGAHLARLEVKTMLDELVQHFPNLSLTSEPVRVGSNFISGISSMPVNLA